MRVDGRDIAVSGSLLQPLIRRTNDILRLTLAGVFLVVIVTSSLITRNEWQALERSISEIVGVLSPAQSNAVYLVYGIAILALPFMILIGLIVARQWKLLGAYAAAGVIAILSLSITGNGIAAPRWHFDLSERLDTVLSQFLDDPRWIAMLAAVLTVSGPWLPAHWRRWWWALLLAFVPIHLVVSAVVPARSLLGLAVGWFVGALVVLVVGTPALEVPLDDAVRAMTRRGFRVSALTVFRPAGRGPLGLTATEDQGADSTDPDAGTAIVELYGPHQRGGGALRQFWGKLRLRDSETAPLQTSMRRAVEHRALMAIAVDDLALANTSPIAMATLERGWTLYAHKPPLGTTIDDCADQTPVSRLWDSLGVLHSQQISHGDLRSKEITVVDGTPMFGGFSYAEYGASEAHLHTDIAQLLLTTTDLYGAEPAVQAAITVFGNEAVLAASRRLTKAAVPKRLRTSVRDAGTAMSTARDEVKRQTGADQIKAATITRFSRSQLIQMVLLVALVYVAYPVHRLGAGVLLGTEHRELVVGGGGAGGVGADVPWRRRRAVGVRGRAGEVPERGHHAGREHVRRDDDACRGRRSGAEHPVPAEGRVGRATRHHRGGASAVGAGDRPRHPVDLLQRRGGRVGEPDAVRAERHRALPDRRRGAGGRRGVPVRPQAPTLAGHRGAAPSQGGHQRPDRAGGRTQTPGGHRTRLWGNDTRGGTGTVGEHRGVRRRHDASSPSRS